MRASALVVLILAHSITPDAQEQEPPYHGDPAQHPRCAAIENDVGELKACKCAARSGSREFCDKDGNRIVEQMPNCVNRAHCLKGRCGCCPRD